MKRQRKRRAPPRPPAEIDIESLSRDGRGVGRLNGKTVFVTGALPGERVQVEFTYVRRDFDEAEAAQILHLSPSRTTPKCPHFGVCGGCSLQHFKAEAQIAAKQAQLIEALQRLGQVRPERILDALTAPVWGYRRKARLGVRYVAKKGRVLVGFRERQGRLLADLTRCEVLVPEVGERLQALAQLIGGLEARERIPQIEVMAGDASTCLVLRHLEPLREADKAALIQFSQKNGLFVALQPSGPDSITPLWPAQQPLFYQHPDFNVRVDFKGGDFIQVNAPINRKMVAQALELLQLTSGDSVLELFSGLGNFTLPMLRRGAHVTAVEGEAGMTRRAMENASANALVGGEFYTADLFNPNPQAAWLRRRYEKVLLDPPRSGAREMLPHLGRLSPSRIVYVSCDPATLARDAGELVHTHGYRLAAAGVMDMFPHTGHVESIAVFSRE